MLTEAHTAILRLINQFGPLSRTELVGQLGVSKASMSAMAAELIDSGMLAEGELVQGSGRPSVRLALRPSAASFVGVSLAPAGFALSVTDLNGRVTHRADGARDGDPRATAQAIASALDQLGAAGDLDRDRIAGIGVAVPGFVDAAAGLCVRSTLLGWRDVAIGPMIAEETGLDTFVENDANALVLGQHLFGDLRGSRTSTLISVGDGIGCGHIIRGELHRGHRGGAGEIAHATVELNGLPCRCGKRGCLDTLASVQAIVHAARGAGLEGGPATLDEAAGNGDQGAIAILHRAGTALGLAIAQIVQSLDPERIIVALAEGPADGLYARVLRQTVDANIMPDGPARTELSLVPLDKEAWAIGAAAVAAGRALFRM